MHVLVVEDEQRLGRLLQRVLTEELHLADVAFNGREGLTLALSGGYDLIILDLMLPDLDGVEICRRLRQADVGTPLLMLTARGSVEDRVAGLTAGADDYLVKPFAMAELLARVAALLRRRERTPDAGSLLQVEDLVLDLGRREARRGRQVIELTPKEFGLLEYLMRNPGMVLSRTQIIDHVWRYDLDAVSNVVDIYINYLRRKVDKGFGRPLIKTVRGVGYKIEAAVSEPHAFP